MINTEISNIRGNKNMGRAKEITLKVIPSKIAGTFVKINNSTLHFGAFLDGGLHGVMSFGPSMDKNNLIKLVEGTRCSNFLELNRMSFDEYLPRNSESFCLGKAFRLIKRNAPQVKWVISFADGCSFGDGTIYRASNFILTGIKKNTDLLLLPSGEKVHKLSLGKYDIKTYLKVSGAQVLEGYQLRYIYFIDKEWRRRLTVPEIPFSKIDEIGAGMYRGQKITLKERHINNAAIGIF